MTTDTGDRDYPQASRSSAGFTFCRHFEQLGMPPRDIAKQWIFQGHHGDVGVLTEDILECSQGSREPSPELCAFAADLVGRKIRLARATPLNWSLDQNGRWVAAELVEGFRAAIFRQNPRARWQLWLTSTLHDDNPDPSGGVHDLSTLQENARLYSELHHERLQRQAHGRGADLTM